LRYLVLISLIIVLSNCKKETISTIDLGLDYYPTEIGFWQTYKVDSISFSDFTDPISIDTSSYFIKEIIESSYLDFDLDTNYRVEQFKSYNDSSWFINHIVSLKKTSVNLQRVENDLRFIKLTFPPKDDQTWGGNKYLDIIDEQSLDFFNPNKFNWEYTYSAVNESQTIGNFTFDSCIVVTQIDEENLFEKKYSKEIYAKNVGLVYKELLILKTQAAPSNNDFIERAENGFILIYTISNFKQ